MLTGTYGAHLSNSRGVPRVRWYAAGVVPPPAGSGSGTPRRRTCGSCTTTGPDDTAATLDYTRLAPLTAATAALARQLLEVPVGLGELQPGGEEEESRAFSTCCASARPRTRPCGVRTRPAPTSSTQSSQEAATGPSLAADLTTSSMRTMPDWSPRPGA
jgi:hypothetical protein